MNVIKWKAEFLKDRQVGCNERTGSAFLGEHVGT